MTIPIICSSMLSYKAILIRYIPGPAVPIILSWFETTNVQLHIKRSRNTKLGDYRPPVNARYHRISVNHNLNKYHFLLTLVHEFAHLKVWEKYKNSVKPHGAEWKRAFKELMLTFLTEDIYPEALLVALKKYLVNPSSSTSNVELLRHLRQFDEVADYLTLEEIPMSSIFRIENGFTFQKLEKMRKRYKCLRLDNCKIYLVSPLIKVDVVKKAV